MAKQSWDHSDLEHVAACPFCGAGEGVVRFSGVQDWTFGVASGEWTYRSCASCASLYLDPRPSPETIGRAYATYYTHGTSPGVMRRTKNRVRNEVWSRILGLDLRPRLNRARFTGALLQPLSHWMLTPFVEFELACRDPGLLVDVGCGDGLLLERLVATGWQLAGIEPDPVAASVARRAGLRVVTGGYPLIREVEESIDCIVCSHVLEHVSDPLDLLRTMYEVLRPGGMLLLATPNAGSVLGDIFGVHWRGLEAPRHLAIPSSRCLEDLMTGMGFSVRARSVTRLWTAAESARIERGGRRINWQDRLRARRLERDIAYDVHKADFIELACEKL